MGDFERTRVTTLHDFSVQRARVTITAEVSLHESWAHLQSDGLGPSEPAGPHNRRIVETLVGTSLTVHGDEVPAALQVLVDELRAHDGLLEGGGVVGFTDPRFRPAVQARFAALDVTFADSGASR